MSCAKLYKQAIFQINYQFTKVTNPIALPLQFLALLGRQNVIYVYYNKISHNRSNKTGSHKK